MRYKREEKQPEMVLMSTGWLADANDIEPTYTRL